MFLYTARIWMMANLLHVFFFMLYVSFLFNNISRTSVGEIALSYFLGTIISFLLSVPSFIAASFILPRLFKLKLSMSQVFFTWIITAMIIVLLNYIGLSYAVNHVFISREFINMSVPSFLSILFPILIFKTAFYRLGEEN